MLGRIRQIPKPLFFLFAGTIVTRMGSFVFPYLTIYLSDGRDFGLDQVGLILSVGSIGLLAGNFAGGWLTDRWSRKWTIVSALLLNAFGFGCLAFEFAFGFQYAILLLIGYFGSGMYNPAANTLIADYTDDELRPFAYTINYVCVNFGMALGPLLGGFLATVAYHWIFIGDVISSLVCACLVMGGIADRMKVSDKDGSQSESEKTPLTNEPIQPVRWFQYRLVLAFCLIYFFLICPLMGLEYAVPLLINNVFKSSLTFVGVIYTINAVCILSFSFLIEKWIRGRNEISMMIVAGLFWSAGLFVLLFGYSIVALMICTVVWTLGEIIASILVPSFIAKRVAHSVKGRFLALNDIVRSFAGVICPIGLGLVWVHQGPVWVVALLTALPVISVGCYVALFWVSRSSTDVGATQLELEGQS